MIRTIKQRLYVIGLLPLAVLAIALVVFNGLARIDDAHIELDNEKRVTAALLQGPAVDALVVGNVLNFEQVVTTLIKTSPMLVCVTLQDTKHRTVTQIGRCDQDFQTLKLFPVSVSSADLSDFGETKNAHSTVGDLGIVMSDEGLLRKQHEVMLQLAFSLLLIVVVLGLVARLLRVRMIERIHEISSAMSALSQRDYSVRVSVSGVDELSKLAEAINQTIDHIATYTRELEHRRNDADRALHDADEANLVRNGLVRALTEDLEAPLGQIDSELTTIAIANKDPVLKEQIRSAITLLQQAQTDFGDLIEIATSSQRTRQSSPRDLSEILADIERDVRLLAGAASAPVNLAFVRLPDSYHREEPSGYFLDIEAVRVKKALAYLIRSMMRRCTDSGVFVNIECLPIAPERMHLSINLKAFYAPLAERGEGVPVELASRYGRIPALAGWTDRDTKIIDYLVRAAGMEPTAATSSMGDASLLLTMTCHYTDSEQAASRAAVERAFVALPISITVVSNDASLTRLTTRGDITNLEIKLVSFDHALKNAPLLRAESVLLIDMSDDIAEVIYLIDHLRSGGSPVPRLIAICPSGRISDSLSDRLLEIGFRGVIQKPLQFGRLVEVIRATLSDLTLQ